jgi:hypothetical protein
MQIFDPPQRWKVPGLAVVALGVALAAPARAQIDLTEVELSVAIQRVNAAGALPEATFLARLVVRATDVARASITPPGGVPLALPETAPDEFTLEQSFPNEAALDAALPDGDYLLDLDTGAETAILPYARPAVPSPAIFSPLQGAVVPTGTVEIRFVPCALCVQSGDSTLAVLEQGAVVLASATLAANVAVWTPADASGPLVLPPSSSFTARVTHTASRTSTLSADPSDAFTFEVVHSEADEIAFSTGFPAPQADLCIVVNDAAGLDPEGRCALHEDLNDAIFDTGGSFVTTAAGVPVTYGFSVSPRGRLSGIADLDLDRDGTFETHVPVAGRLSGEDGRLRQSVRIAVKSSAPAPDARLKLKIQEQTDTVAFLTTRVQTTKGRLLGARVAETSSITEAIDDAPRGWRLDFDVSGASGEITDAQLVLSSGRTIPLFGRHRFLFDVNRTNVRLRSGGADRGVDVAIDTLALDAGGSIVRGVLRYRALGQSGTLRFR